jgi:hypothetical protein
LNCDVFNWNHVCIQTKYITSYLVLPIKESDNEKTVCNPTRQAGSPTKHSCHIYMQTSCGHGRYLLRPSPHLSLVVDLVAEEPNARKTATEKTHSYHTGKEEFMDPMPRFHQSAERIYTYFAWTRKGTCKCQIKQYSYMQSIINHTLVRATIVSTSDCARMSWLLDVSLFMMVTSRNRKMRRNRGIGTTSVRILIPIIWHVKKNSNHIAYQKQILNHTTCQ